MTEPSGGEHPSVCQWIALGAGDAYNPLWTCKLHLVLASYIYVDLRLMHIFLSSFDRPGVVSILAMYHNYIWYPHLLDLYSCLRCIICCV